MGEYGTPNVDIPEGWFDLEYRGRTTRALFPRLPHSLYHASKVHDSTNVEFACRAWGLRSTDIMQGVVYGTRIDEMGDDPLLATRFDYDQAFGTAINRFCAQAAAGMPITPYGSGTQRRGFLPLRDSMQCLTLTLENPPEPGEYRVFNQFEESYTIADLAAEVQRAAKDEAWLEPAIKHVDNPRAESEDHYYNPDHSKLLALGYRPTGNMNRELRSMLRCLRPHRERIKAHAHSLTPDVRWDGSRARCEYLEDEDR